MDERREAAGRAEPTGGRGRGSARGATCPARASRPSGRPGPRLAARFGRLRGRAGDDAGFTLLETVISITIVTVVMAALTLLYVRSISVLTHQRSAQSAARIETQAVDYARALGAAGAVAGRDAGSVATQWAAAPADVQPWLATMDQAADPAATAGSGTTADLPTMPVTGTVDNRPYQTSYYVGWCYRLRSTGSSDAACVPKAAESTDPSVQYAQYTRVVVSVGWTDTSCGASSAAACRRLTAVLLSGATDPVFNFNATPPASPTLSGCLDQQSAVGDVYSDGTGATFPPLPVVQTSADETTTPICALKDGVPPFTFTATGLPAGLAMTATGQVTGTVTAPAGTTTTVTITVTDAFLHTSTGNSFTWTVLQPLTVAAVPNQTAVVGVAASGPTMSATGGSGAPYTWAATGVPPGIGLSKTTGVFSGTPTSTGSFHVTVTATDKSGIRTASTAFGWTVYDPLVATDPAAQAGTVGQAVSPLPLQVSGGSGAYTVTDPSVTLPSGLALTGDATSGYRVTGTPTTAVTASVDLVATDAASGQATDIAFTWTVYPAPTIVGPGDQKSGVGTAVSLAVQASCPNGGCTFTASGLPSWLTIGTTTGVISGTAPTSPATVSGITVTATDAAGATATTAPFGWTVTDGPTLTDPGDQVDHVGDTVNLPVAGACGQHPPCSWAVSGTLPTGVAFDTSTGTFAGTASATGTFGPITVTRTDALGQSDAVSFGWNVFAKPTLTAPGTQSWTEHTEIAAVTPTSSCGWTPCTFSATGLPTGLSIDIASGQLSGSPTAAGTGTATLKITDGGGATATASFAWTVRSDLALAIPGQAGAPGTGVTLDLTAFTDGGTPAYGGYAVAAGTLPTGLALSAGGTVTGTPTTVGSFSGIQVSVTDAEGSTVTSPAFTWTITSKLAISGIANQRTAVGVAATAVTPTVTGAYGAETFSATGLPAGLSIAASTGKITGTPTTAGTKTVTVSVSDSSGTAPVSTTFTWYVLGFTVPGQATSCATNGGSSNCLSTATATVTLSATGGSGSQSYAVVSTPSGVTAKVSGATLTLTTARVGSYPITVAVIDGGGGAPAVTVQTQFTWTVSKQ